MINPQLLALFSGILVSFIEGVIVLRIILKLMGASTVAPFVRWVYETSKPLLYPFEGMFPSSQVGGIPFTIEFSALFALFVYVFVGYLIQEVLEFIQIFKEGKELHKNAKKV
jgi:uncharacterized protein YggT (Ycf19 family)